MGTSCFAHSSPLYHSLSSSSSSSSFPYRSQSVLLYSLPRNGSHCRKKNRGTTASMHRDNDCESVFCKRRAILFVGISVLPILGLKAKALEEPLVTDELQAKTPEQLQKETLQGDAPPNAFLSLLNGLGVFGSGVLGALYALARNEKIDSEAKIEFMKSQLSEKDAAIVSLEKKYELKLLKEKEEGNQQLQKAKEEQKSLMNQISMANSTVTGLGQELQREKRLVEDLNIQIEDLQKYLQKTKEGKEDLEERLKEKLTSIEVLEERVALLTSEIKDKEDTIRDVSSELSAKVADLEKLSSIYEQAKDDLSRANSEAERLNQQLQNNQKELELKNAAVDDLNVQLSSLIAQRDESNRKFDAIQKEYDDLKSSSEEKAVTDAKLLGERDYEILQLKEKIDLALDEVSRNQVLVSDLTQERDDLKKMLGIEVNSTNSLKHELRITQEALGNSRNEVSDLTKHLKQSRTLCSDLEAELTKVRTEFSEARDSFHRSFDEAKHDAEVLAGEVSSLQEVLNKTKEELFTVSSELAATTVARDGLQKELVDVYKKVESATQSLKEEKKAVTALNTEVQTLHAQILKDGELRRSIEMDLDDATKSLNEMNRNALLLSSDLEMSRTSISNLEDERDLLYKSLEEQKQVTQEVRENMEDANNLVMRLGKERDSLERRSKKMEEELASAKGEILRLRSKISSSRAATVNDQKPQAEAQAEEEKVEAVEIAVPSVKKSRRKKADVKTK